MRSKSACSARASKGRGGFVADQQRGVPVEAAGDRDPLPLAAGELLAALEPAVEQGVAAVGQLGHDLVGPGDLGGAP
jgi:hypothetical protein